ncbi:MAG: chalcone isomerase family protein [Burkholderiales bacterium]|nr:chalcone isomerase family protein [Burkholderiales bacterium]
MQMQTLRRFVSALVLGCAVSGAWATVDVSGVPLEDTVTVGGQQLHLNGAGYRKRGYFKIDVTALYLQQKATTLDAVENAPGAKRLQLVIQQDITGSQASRYFLIDFEASATPAEFAKLITEVSQVGDIYSALPKIKKGDVVTMDWVPGKGLIATLNGTNLTPHGATSPYMNSELLARVMLRMYIGGKTPAELHDNLLGVSSSMRDKK